MRIAFTSCFSAEDFPDQPVWKEIASAQPDVLLLGDSIYLDQSDGLIAGVARSLNPRGAQGLDAKAFAQHAHRLYQKQLEQEQFRALLATMNLRTYAIWATMISSGITPAAQTSWAARWNSLSMRAARSLRRGARRCRASLSPRRRPPSTRKRARPAIAASISD